jgi:hypothetical protein
VRLPIPPQFFVCRRDSRDDSDRGEQPQLAGISVIPHTEGVLGPQRVPGGPSAAERTEASECRFVWLLGILAVLGAFWLWVLPLRNSFWLDETLVVSVIQGGFAETLKHSALWPQQSPLFSAVEWIVGQLAGGSNEFALRLPSVLAAIATVYIWYRLGIEFFDRESGVIFAALYTVLPQIAAEVPNVRPYSIGLLAEVSALLFFLRWLRSMQVRDALFCAVCSSLAVQLHILFMIGMGIEAAFVLVLKLRGKFVDLRQFALAAVTAITLVLPAIPHAIMLFRERRLLPIPWIQSVAELVGALIPTACIPIVIPALILAVSEGWRPSQKKGDAVALGFAWLFIPTLGLFALSRLAGISVFPPRYLLPTIPGFILCWGWFLRSIEPRALRRCLVVAVLVVTALMTGGLSAIPNYHPEDWRAAVKSLPPNGATLVYPGLVETRRLDWLRAPERWHYLMAPALAYRPDLSPQRALALPFTFGDEETSYIDQYLPAFLDRQESVTILARGNFSSREWMSWLSQRVRERGFRQVSRSQFKMVETAVFQK